MELTVAAVAGVPERLFPQNILLSSQITDRNLVQLPET